MGLYEINCVACSKPFVWFSGTMDQRCDVCRKESAKNAKAMALTNELAEWCAKNGYLLGMETMSKLHEILVRELP